MFITHEEARKLIQFEADESLRLNLKNMLLSHLEDCAECRTYADSLRRMESVLKPMMKRQWTQPHLPLPVGALLSNGTPRKPSSMVLATRISVVGMIAIAFLFSVWQFTVSIGPTPGPVSASAPPIPTPSTQLTGTGTTSQTCTQTRYIVQENDTLESIAFRFAVSKEDLMADNQIDNETVLIGTELIILACNSTPTGTVHPTFTPLLSPTITTPGGQPTQ